MQGVGVSQQTEGTMQGVGVSQQTEGTMQGVGDVCIL